MFSQYVLLALALTHGLVCIFRPCKQGCPDKFIFLYPHLSPGHVFLTACWLYTSPLHQQLFRYGPDVKSREQEMVQNHDQNQKLT